MPPHISVVGEALNVNEQWKNLHIAHADLRLLIVLMKGEEFNVFLALLAMG